MQTYEPGAQPVVIDFEDDFEDATDYYTERSDISTGDDMTHMISPRSQLSLVDDIPEEAPESAAVEDTVETVSMLPENEVDEERELSSKVSLTTTAVLKQTQHKILPLDTGFASSNFLELQKRLEQKSANKKPPTFVPPASDKSLRTQFFGNHRVVTPLSSSSINVNSKK